MKKLEEMKQTLEKTLTFPTSHIFKFIVKNIPANKSLMQSLFPGTQLREKFSKNGQYVSYTATIMAQSADEIMAIYEKAATIDGIVML